jgi:hypothetical protein
MQKERWPAIYNIRHSNPGDPEHYSLIAMMGWATLPYMIWQLGYHVFISVRRAEKIAAGRPTSFTWLRRSYAKTWIGKFVLRQPENWQEPTFMMVQYVYAMCTVLPCPFWFWYRWASAGFLAVVFIWSIHNGATYYIDVFGKRFQKELEAMRAEVAKWHDVMDQNGNITSPGLTPYLEKTREEAEKQASERDIVSVDSIPLLNEEKGSIVDVLSTAVDMGAKDLAKQRKPSEDSVAAASESRDASADSTAS